MEGKGRAEQESSPPDVVFQENPEEQAARSYQSTGAPAKRRAKASGNCSAVLAED